MKASSCSLICILFFGLALFTLPGNFAHGQGSELQGTNSSRLFGQLSNAFSGGQAVQSVQLSGNAIWYAGSLEDSGTVSLTASTDGSSHMQLVLDSDTRTETQDTFANGQGCSWGGNDGVTHDSPAHNCLIPIAWFLPEVALFSTKQPMDTTLSFLTGQAGQTDLRWTLNSATNTPTDQAELLSHIGTYDLWFDEITLLPGSLLYTVHPDNNAGVDIPVIITYSDYRYVSGTAVPFHIQRYFNGSLSLDITLTNAAITR